MEGKRLSDDSVLKTDPRYRKLEHLIQVRVYTERNAKSQNTKCQIQRDKYLTDRCLYRGKNIKVMNNQYNELTSEL